MISLKVLWYHTIPQRKHNYFLAKTLNFEDIREIVSIHAEISYEEEICELYLSLLNEIFKDFSNRKTTLKGCFVD